MDYVFRGVSQSDVVTHVGTTQIDPVTAYDLKDTDAAFFNNTTTPGNFYCLCSDGSVTEITIEGVGPVYAEGYGGSHPTDPPDLKAGDDSE